MYRAGATGVMLKVYTKDTIGKICEMLIDGKSRKEIVETLGVNKNLVYDVKTGNYHRSISEKYIDKGFKYHEKGNKEEKDREAEEICKYIVNTDFNDTKISKILNCDRRKVSAIRSRFCYKHISSKYGII